MMLWIFLGGGRKMTMKSRAATCHQQFETFPEPGCHVELMRGLFFVA